MPEFHFFLPVAISLFFPFHPFISFTTCVFTDILKKKGEIRKTIIQTQKSLQDYTRQLEWVEKSNRNVEHGILESFSLVMQVHFILKYKSFLFLQLIMMFRSFHTGKNIQVVEYNVKTKACRPNRNTVHYFIPSIFLYCFSFYFCFSVSTKRQATHWTLCAFTLLLHC